VIGPAVNLASRLQDLTKVVSTPILASAAFAAASSRKLRALGGQRVRGLETEVQVFAPV
jgi:adenylate cyclase